MLGPFTRALLFAFAALATLLVPAGANNFLMTSPASRLDRVLTEEVRQSLFSELANSFGSRRLDRIQTAIRPTYIALPKDEHGNLDSTGVRYVLHRYFVQLHSWFMKGLRPADSSALQTMSDRVPAYIVNIFEHRLGKHGFGMYELAVFAATLEDLVHQDAIRKLEAAYIALQVNVTDRVSEDVVDDVLDGYMMTYIVNADVSRLTRDNLRAVEESVQYIYPTWPETRLWLRDLKIGAEHVGRHRRNPFVKGMSFAETSKVIETIGDQFGAFQAIECHDLKSVLLQREHQGTGRVRLSRFYEKWEGIAWDFNESTAYLRHLGVLDETDPSQVSVVIANYVNSLTCCIAAGDFYSVCCRDECESLFDHLEEQIAAPEAAPERIAALIASLPSDTVPAPRNLSNTLVSRLQEIARHNHGRVLLHGRLFAQWMHHAYPRECSFPQVGGAVGTYTLTAWRQEMGRASATPEEKRLYIEAGFSSSADDEFNMTVEDSSETLPWSAVEEIIVGRRTSLITVFSLRNCGFIAVLAATVVTMVRAGAAGRADVKVESHFV